jgi:hypothetical protein
LIAAVQVFAQDVDGLVVEDNAAVLVSLGVFLDPIALVVEADRAVDRSLLLPR